MANSINKPHRRFNPLTGEWVLVSPQRTQRPWQGQQEAIEDKKLPQYSETCYLCPGNIRANKEKNKIYTGTYVFPNDFPALLPQKEESLLNTKSDDLFQSMPTCGENHVICYSPDHSKTLPYMSITEIESIINTWSTQIIRLEKEYQWVQCFENKGSMMGCSNPHPHGQIWACDFLPTEVAKEDQQQQYFYQKHHSAMLLRYAEEELKYKDRIVLENGDWIVITPYWATWPFETLLLPTFPICSLPEINAAQKTSLASILKKLTIKYDNVFKTSFPYSMGWHGAPAYTTQSKEHWQLHAHFYPPLLRSATVKKFMVGFELLAESQRDLLPEHAAARLREV